MKQELVSLISGYLTLTSFLGFIIMGIDKRRAVKKAWRIPERTLLLTAFLGGGIGAFLVMYVFRHKTKHSRFVVLMPVAAALYVIILLILYNII
jgi:uncharacterized membrane protein YsdA (DUF1294 family)